MRREGSAGEAPSGPGCVRSCSRWRASRGCAAGGARIRWRQTRHATAYVSELTHADTAAFAGLAAMTLVTSDAGRRRSPGHCPRNAESHPCQSRQRCRRRRTPWAAWLGDPRGPRAARPCGSRLDDAGSHRVRAAASPSTSTSALPAQPPDDRVSAAAASGVALVLATRSRRSPTARAAPGGSTSGSRSGEAWTYRRGWRVRLDAPGAASGSRAPGVLQPDGSRLRRNGRDYSFAAGRLRSLRGGGGRGGGDRMGAGGPRRSGSWSARWRSHAAAAPAAGRAVRPVRLARPAGRRHGLHGDGAQRADHDPARRLHRGPRAGARVVVRLGRGRPAEAPWLDESFATYAEEAVLGQKPWCEAGPGRAAAHPWRPLLARTG